MLARASAVVVLALIITAPLQAQDPDLLVSTDWLARHHTDQDLMILHVGRDRLGYDRGHVPGARFLPMSAIVVTRDGLPNELPPVAVLDSVFESVGVSDGSRVILYGDPLAAARAFFTLDYLGHRGTALLDGGIESWTGSGAPVETASPVVKPGIFTPHPVAALVPDAAAVEQRLGRLHVTLIDARPAPEYSGATAGEGIDRPGHIPGAASIFWKTTLVSDADPRLKPAAALGEPFLGAGAAAGDTVVAYCRTGVQASFAYFVARYLGHPAMLYDGSYQDWSHRPALPVRAGTER